MFKNENKRYYCDFVFEDLKVIVELDGQQHLLTVSEDRIRDDFLTKSGYSVIRIDHKTYRSGTMNDQLLTILSPLIGVSNAEFSIPEKFWSVLGDSNPPTSTWKEDMITSFTKDA